jgi:hypothetical protein
MLDLSVAGLNWLEIPNYQRGISWGVEEVVEFLESDSVLLGNVILGHFSRGSRFPHLPSGISDYNVLVDGLQRFTVGTGLLALLYPLVLAPTPSRLAEAAFFAPLKSLVQSRAAAFQHNDTQLLNHQRRAIRDQYASLRDSLRDYIEERFNRGEAQPLAKVVNATMLQKQIAVDVYFNFADSVKLMNTFLGLNTVRVDLGPVDLLRAFIVEKATSSGWRPETVEEMENDFTQVFTQNDSPDAELLPFVSVVLGCLRSDAESIHVFPSWVSTLTENDVDSFLEFVTAFKSSQGGNGYFEEIRQCGSIPFAMLLSYYYRQTLQGGSLPSFLSGGNSEDGDLHRLLVACYRAYFDRQIGRTRDFADKCLRGNFATLGDVANSMSMQVLGLTVDQVVDDAWLMTALGRIDKNRARRVFNAMLLPDKSAGFGVTNFQPIPFGRRAREYQVDHLIPDSMLEEDEPGYSEGQTLRNFAPLTQNQNRVAKATSCSSKLATGGIYDNYLAIQGSAAHPYCRWLTLHHAPRHGAGLDDQSLLEPNRNPDIGTERLEKIKSDLLARL